MNGLISLLGIFLKKNWKDRKVFVRLHRYEIDSKYMNLINWSNINQLIFVNSVYENDFNNKINKLVKTITIPNAININSFPNNKINYGKNIALFIFSSLLNLLQNIIPAIKSSSELYPQLFQNSFILEFCHIL